MSSVGVSAEELRIWCIVWSWPLTDVWEWGFLCGYLCVFKAHSVCRVSSAVNTHWIWMSCGWGQLLMKKKENSVLVSFKACMTFFIGAQKEDLFWEPFALVNAVTVNGAFKLHRGPQKNHEICQYDSLSILKLLKNLFALRKRWKFKSKCSDNLVLQHKKLTWRIRPWCNQVISERSYVTLDHNTSHKGQMRFIHHMNVHMKLNK